MEPYGSSGGKYKPQDRSLSFCGSFLGKGKEEGPGTQNSKSRHRTFEKKQKMAGNMVLIGSFYKVFRACPGKNAKSFSVIDSAFKCLDRMVKCIEEPIPVFGPIEADQVRFFQQSVQIS